MPRTLRHWTPRYLWNRMGLMLYQRRNPQTPWLTQTAIGLLEDWLKPTDNGLEWGAGRSTCWFARRIGHLVSVESDRQWFARVELQLLAEEFKNVTLCYAAADYTLESRADQPTTVQIAADLADSSLDFVLVDGTLREYCVVKLHWPSSNRVDC